MRQLYLASTVVAGIVCCGQSLVNAQGAEPTPAPGATATPAAEPWTFTLGVGGTYEGNALFVGADDNQEAS
jgi:hypothetical protein